MGTLTSNGADNDNAGQEGMSFGKAVPIMESEVGTGSTSRWADDIDEDRRLVLEDGAVEARVAEGATPKTLPTDLEQLQENPMESAK